MIPNWYLFGLALKVPEAILDQLRVQDYTDKDCLIEVIDHWLRHHYSPSTWQEIFEAKRKVEFYNLAKTIPHVHKYEEVAM